MRDACRDGAGGETARLGVTNPLTSQLETDFGELSGLARTGFTGEDDDLMVGDGAGDFLAPLRNRKLGRIQNGRRRRDCGHMQL